MTPTPPDLDLTVLVELDATGRCATALRSLAKQTLARKRFEIVGVSPGPAEIPTALRVQVDWLLAESAGVAGVLHVAFNRATRLASATTSACSRTRRPNTWPGNMPIARRASSTTGSC